MRHSVASLCAAPLAMILIGCTACAAADGPLNTPPAGFTALFNGANLDGWYGHGTQDPRTLWAMGDALAAHKEKTRADLRAHWRVDGGILINDGQGLYATTDKDYGDFELLVEYKTVATADSGIYLRAVPQVQIWDYTEAGGKWSIGADKGSGGLWNNSPGAPGKDPLVLADKAFGEWNALRIIMVGERVTVFLNGKRVVDHARMENYFDRDRKLPVFPKGPIQLQTHGGEICWRNVFLREIAAEEACAILRAGGVEKPAADGGFAPIFNGKDWTGWKGPTGQNVIADGAIHAQSGTIFTEEEFEDFAVRFQFTLPKGGNNGLAIRYPGAGDTAYVGMCELQVLDNEDPQYATLDPRQYHGSAYGMAAAHRGYLRAPGEWNFQCVTVKSSTIVVELNGTRILDADLGKITKAMYELDKFGGRNRTKGSFGFAGHGLPVKFRAIELKKL